MTRRPFGAWTTVFCIFLATTNTAAAVFGIAMLIWALQQLGYEGEQWGLLGIMVCSFVSVPAMLLVLMPGTIRLVCAAKERLGRAFRGFLIGALLVGLGANLAALACIPLASYQHASRFKKNNPLYTTGLYDAVKQGDLTKADPILKANPSLVHGDPYDFSLLAVAVRNGDQPMVELLLSHGADVDGGGGQPTPLHFAARHGDVEIARILLDHGADVNAEDCDSDPNTPLVYAEDAQEPAMVTFLRSKGGGRVNLKSAAWRAAYFNKPDELRAILDQGLDVDVRWAAGTLLHTAAEEAHVEIIKLLLERGARMDIALGLGTPLHGAAYHGRTQAIQYLISRGAKVNSTEPQNNTALYWAAGEGHADTVRALLEAGADPNLGESALKEAQRQGHTDVAQLLIQHGAK